MTTESTKMKESILSAMLTGLITEHDIDSILAVAAGARALGIALHVGDPEFCTDILAIKAIETLPWMHTIDKHKKANELVRFRQLNQKDPSIGCFKIHIIKLIRNQFGMGLADAKAVSEILYDNKF